MSGSTLSTSGPGGEAATRPHAGDRSSSSAEAAVRRQAGDCVSSRVEAAARPQAGDRSSRSGEAAARRQAGECWWGSEGKRGGGSPLCSLSSKTRCMVEYVSVCGGIEQQGQKYYRGPAATGGERGRL